MQQFVPVTAANVQIDWYDANGNIGTACTRANCIGVAVSIKDLSITPFSPLAWIGLSSLSSRLHDLPQPWNHGPGSGQQRCLQLSPVSSGSSRRA